MCRIAGIIDKNEELMLTSVKVSKMCNVMAHGGPDDAGLYENITGDLVFGHRRLALIDLSARGHQPMVYNEQYVITFNGEIYNYLILKKELEILGFKFNSNSDTEVILAGFACWGTAVFDKLSGMFVFALHDKSNNHTYLVRDQAGIKPLYYSTTDQKLIFSSEVKAFKQLTTEEDPDWKIYFLAFGHIPEPYTTLKDVFMLPKAHYLKWDHLGNTHEIFSFHKEAQQNLITENNKAQSAVKHTLEEAVERHLIADSPIGIFLSGGIDSSLLTLLANQIQHKNSQQLHTISINFKDQAFSEKPYQDCILEKVNSKHYEYTLDEETFSAYFPAALAAMDQPTADGINSWFINHYAKINGLKAFLSGVGADELFGGYPSFKRMDMVNFLSYLPNFILKLGLKTTATTFKRAYYLSYKNTIGKYLFLRGVFTPDEIGKLLNLPIDVVDEKLKNLPIPTMSASLSNAEQASWLEANLYMQNQLLKDTDFMSMQHGIEVRVPFLDKELLKLIHSISNAVKYKTNKKKGLLIDSFIKLLPKKIWYRPKMGFTFPFQQWLKDNAYFQEQLANCTNTRAKELINHFKSGELHWSKAMAIYQVFTTPVPEPARQDKERSTTMPKKILLLTLNTFSLTGGIEKVSKILSKVLDDVSATKKYQVDRINTLSLCDQQKDIDLTYCKKENFKGFGYHKLKFGMMAIFNGLRSNTIILSHINLLPIAYCVKFFSSKTKIIMLAHGVEVWRNIKPWKSNFLDQHAEIWAVSEFTAKVLQEKHGIKEHQIKILNNCLDPYLVLPKNFAKPVHLLERYQLKENQPILLTVSRLSSHELYKGYDLVIEAMPALLRKFPNLIYILAGKADLSEKTRLNTLIQSRQLHEHILLIDYIADHELVDHFLLGDLFVMPSKKEGFGIVFIEAASCGCPVIAGNQDGSTDALLNGELGALINPESTAELINAIEQTLTRGKNNEMSLALQQKCLSHFSYQQYKHKVIALLQRP